MSGSEPARPGEFWRFPPADPERLVFVVDEDRKATLDRNAIWVSDRNGGQVGTSCFVSTRNPSHSGERVPNDEVPDWAFKAVAEWALSGAEIDR